MKTDIYINLFLVRVRVRVRVRDEITCGEVTQHFLNPFMQSGLFYNNALLNRISHGTDSSRRCDKFDRIFHIRTKVKNMFCGFRVFNPNEFVTH